MTENTGISIEFFAAKGTNAGFIAVPQHCGLQEANILYLNGLKTVAMKDEVVLPIDFPDFTQSIREKLIVMMEAGKQLPVSEFRAGGVEDTYFLELRIT